MLNYQRVSGVVKSLRSCAARMLVVSSAIQNLTQRCVIHKDLPDVPSGNDCHINMTIEIVDFPIKDGGSFYFYVKRPEGMSYFILSKNELTLCEAIF